MTQETVTMTKEYKERLEKQIAFIQYEVESIYSKASLLEDLCLKIREELISIE